MNLSQEAIKYILLSLGIVVVCYSVFLLYKEAMDSRGEILKLKEKINTLSETLDSLVIDDEDDDDEEITRDNLTSNTLSLDKIVENSYHLGNLQKATDNQKSYIEEVVEPEIQDKDEPKVEPEPKEEELTFVPEKTQKPAKKTKKTAKTKTV